MLAALNKPWFVFRPAQVLRRTRVPDTDCCLTRLPWGDAIEVCPREKIGSSIARTGVFELAVSEVIARLLDPDDVAVDAGANIGYMTSLMASRARRVVAFEPQPEVYARLARNASRWAGDIELHECALSDSAGEATLTMGADFAGNMGTASLGSGEGITVRTARLADEVDGPVGLLKIDVEGHELAVLDGAPLADVRDLIFEENRQLPSPVTERLTDEGFHLFGLEQRFTGVRLAPPAEAVRLWDAPTYLATREPARALARTGRGWRVLRRP